MRLSIALSFIGFCLAGAAIVRYRPPFVPDRAGYIDCLTVPHPERYCRITYMEPR